MEINTFVKKMGGQTAWDTFRLLESGSKEEDKLKPRYVYTCRCGLVDLRHFYQLMYVAMMRGHEFAIERGIEHEKEDVIRDQLPGVNTELSGFAPEDITSNALGAYAGSLFGPFIAINPSKRRNFPSPDKMLDIVKKVLTKCVPVRWSKLTQAEKDMIINYYNMGTREAPGEGTKNTRMTPGPDRISKDCGPCKKANNSFPFKIDPNNNAKIIGE
jgi:hypothetical protein